MGTATEHSAQTFLAHREVTQKLQHVEQYGNGYRVQHNGLQRVDHLDSHAEQNWNELDLECVGILPARSENVIGGETSRGEYEDERKL